MFQAYKVKLEEMIVPGIRTYTYKNCSIGVSIEQEGLVVSIAPHDYEKPPVLPEMSELNELIAYFGIDPSMPYETYWVKHPYNPHFGDTQYFIQPA